MHAEPLNGDSPRGTGSDSDGQSAGEYRVRIRRRSRRSAGGGIRTVISDIPGWLLAALLVAAPWAYGTTFPETRELLARALCCVGIIYALSLPLRGQWPRLNWVSVLLGLLILGYGWWMAWNAKLVYDPELFYFHPVAAPIRTWPGSVDQKTSADQMLLITGLFGAFWITADLSSRERWRRRLWLILSLTGVSIMLLGLGQRLSSAPGIFWRTDLECGHTFFATYRYHANAGSFINIILPFVAAQGVYAFRKDSLGFWKVFWVLALLSVLASAFVNVSRAATLISGGVLLMFLVWQFAATVRAHRNRLNILQMGIVLVLVIGGVWLLVQEVGFGKAYERWQQLGGTLADNFRYVAYDTIEHQILPQSGWWGFGPNTFSLIFPFFTVHLGHSIWGFWEQAHEDYLQTLVEWGISGAILWFLFFGNTIGRAFWSIWRQRQTWDTRTRLVAGASLLSIGSVLVHSTVDFPMQIASLELYTAVVLGLVASIQFADAVRVRHVEVPSSEQDRLQRVAFSSSAERKA
jgi:hypothetical protein